nr:hypothetical protein [Pandoravirus massiliensis]
MTLFFYDAQIRAHFGMRLIFSLFFLMRCRFGSNANRHPTQRNPSTSAIHAFYIHFFVATDGRPFGWGRLGTLPFRLGLSVCVWTGQQKTQRKTRFFLWAQQRPKGDACGLRQTGSVAPHANIVDVHTRRDHKTTWSRDDWAPAHGPPRHGTVDGKRYCVTVIINRPIDRPAHPRRHDSQPRCRR